MKAKLSKQISYIPESIGLEIEFTGGCKFYLSENGVWLTEEVTYKFIIKQEE